MKEMPHATFPKRALGPTGREREKPPGEKTIRGVPPNLEEKKNVENCTKRGPKTPGERQFKNPH